jgi:hypothetical protein
MSIWQIKDLNEITALDYASMQGIVGGQTAVCTQPLPSPPPAPAQSTADSNPQIPIGNPTGYMGYIDCGGTAIPMLSAYLPLKD